MLIEFVSLGPRSIYCPEAYNIVIRSCKRWNKKSVVIDIREKNKNKTNTVEDIHLKMGDTPMLNVDRATHLGIIRTTSMKSNIRANVDENITKSRRSAYSLFGSGFHGNNGIDPESLLHILVYKTYVLPILL